MEHKNINDFFYKRGMKAISIILSGTTLLGVATGITAYSLANRKNKKDVLPTSPTSTSTTTPDNNQETELLVLADDFSATELDKVAKRAKDIFKLSKEEYSKEEEYTELDIANMIYILGENYDAITYPESAKTDAEKHKYLQDLALLFSKVFDDGLYKYTDALVSDDVVLDKEKPVPCGYMFIPSEILETKEDGTIVYKESKGKKLAIAVAKLYYQQMKNIRLKDENALVKTAKSYYTLYASLEKADLTLAEKVVLYKQFCAINPLFTQYLDMSQAEDLDNVLGKCSAATNIIFQTAAKKLNISDILDDGNFGKNTTPLTEGYNASDEQAANNHPAAGNNSTSEDKKVVVEEGGKPVDNSSGKQEVKNEPTTKVEKETFYVTHPSTGAVIVTPGESVVSEETFIVKIEDYEGTTVVYEEGGEIVVKRFVDGDKVSDNELSTIYTLG